MCGIVGILSQSDVVASLLEGLKKLEYRGYDSSGIAVIAQGMILRRRSPGKLQALIQSVTDSPLKGLAGIGHTRWATHGSVNEDNAHPHLTDRVAVVHNGIIENYCQLKEELQQFGYQFVTQTDTESIVFLIDFYLNQNFNPIEAVRKALQKLEGSFALAILFRDHPNCIIGTRRGSPLVCGIGALGACLASDALALSLWTHTACYLEDDDIVVLRRDQDRFFTDLFNGTGDSVERPTHPISCLAQTAEKGSYKHFMLKEIYEQPSSVQATIDSLFNYEKKEIYFSERLTQMIRNAKRIKIIACGTSYYAGLIGQYWLEELGRLGVEVEIASEFRYRKPFLQDTDLAILISQSGETIDTLASLELLKTNRIPTLSIVNVPESSLMRQTDFCIQTMAGPEIGVATTKAFTSQLIVLITLTFLRTQSFMNSASWWESVNFLWKVPSILSHILDQYNAIIELCKPMVFARDVLYVGRGINFPIAMEGALKLKELSYIHAEGYPAGELKHGPIALVDSSVFVIAVAPSDQWFTKTISNIQEIQVRGGQIIVLTDSTGAEHFARYHQFSNIKILVLPDLPFPMYNPILYAIPVQLFAYSLAVLKGTDVDQPRNLAKSVTVE
jgi:glucosamine--fructose-6-phosphate aminotransferase (isomerizing)